MARPPLPVPDLPDPPVIDPFRHRTAFRRFLSELYHAEKAAMEGFALLTDPATVRSAELFTAASRSLIEDEATHLRDMAAMIALLDDGGILPPDALSQEFWTAWRSGETFALPFRPGVAAMLILLTEGMGYVLLYNLAHATLDPEIRGMLLSNVRDEQDHLRISMSVLRHALEQEQDLALDLVLHGIGFALLARRPLRRQREVLEALGFDFEVAVATTLRFVRDLALQVLDELGRVVDARRLRGPLVERLCSPSGVRALLALSVLPEPPLLRRLIRSRGAAEAVT